MAKNMGKVFEEEIKDSFPKDFYVERYKDDTAGFHGVTNPADFRIYKYPYTFLIELKTHKGTSIPLDRIRDNQLKGLAKAVVHRGIFGGFIFNFRDLEETYYVPVLEVVKFINSNERKSLPVEWCKEVGRKIPQKKKKVRYTYDLKVWLDGYYLDYAYSAYWRVGT